MSVMSAEMKSQKIGQEKIIKFFRGKRGGSVALFFVLFSLSSAVSLLTAKPVSAATFLHSFSDNFDALTSGAISGQNGWATGGQGTWTVGSGGTGGGKMVSQTSTSSTGFYLTYISNGSSTWTDQQLQFDFDASSDNSGPQFWLRKTAATGDGGGYFIYYYSGTWTLAYHVAGGGGASYPTLATVTTSTVSANTWYTVIMQVVNNTNGNPVISLYVYPQNGTVPSTPILTYTDTANLFQSGYFGLGSPGQGASISYDNVVVNYNTAATSYTLIGSSTATVGVGSVFTVTPNANYSGTLTPTSSAGGTFSPTSLTFSSSSATQTFTFTPSTTGTTTISAASNPALTNPSPIAVTVWSALMIVSPARAVSASSTVATLAITNTAGKTFYIPYIQTSSTLSISASAVSSSVPAGGGVEFVLNQGLSGQQTLYALGGGSSYNVNFTNLAKGTYTLDAYIVNASKVVQAGYHDQETDIGIGDIITAIGDSITAGFPYWYSPVYDWVSAGAAGDPISSDGRNYPQYDPNSGDYHPGYLVELNNLLSTYYGYPVFIMNEGYSGITSGGYDSFMMTTQWQNRETALAPDKWLIHLGVNDANQSVATSTYAANMQTIINNLITSYSASSSEIFIADPSYIQPSGSAVEQSYLPVVSNLIAQNNLSKGPNFYSYFEPYYSTLYVDKFHPNPTGYIEMGELWSLSLMSPQNIQVSQNAGTAMLSWSDLSAYHSQINGYTVAYGTNIGNYATTLDVGNVTKTNITGLASGETYYFTVSGYYNDSTSTTVNQTAYSSPVSLAMQNSGTSVASFSGGSSSYDISIDGDASTTTSSNVTLSLYGTQAYTMELSKTSSFASSTWIPYVTSLPWTLASSTGEQTVYVQYRSVSGNIIGNAHASIDLTNASTSASTSATSTADMSISQLQTLLASLEAQLQTLEAQAGTQTSSTSSSYVFTRDLELGMTGADVKQLQLFLIAQNSGSAAQTLKAHGATTNFGSLTKAALAEFQKKAGITPAAGYFGERTRGYIGSL
jgi:hypothetical protein